MQTRHTNRRQYFNELARTCEAYFLPYISRFKTVDGGTRVLEVGCGDGGNLVPFARMGCEVTGVDLAKSRIEDARRFFQEEGLDASFIATDVFLLTELHNKFDVIVCHDVIEHIGDKHQFMGKLKDFLAPDGIIFMSFPAWQMPFGGHQQICSGKTLSHLPFIHLLPVRAYKWLLSRGHESEGCINELLSIKETRCPIELFEKQLRKAGSLKVLDRTFYFINPHYEVKFGLRPRKLWGIVGGIPYLRNFFTSSCFYILTK